MAGDVTGERNPQVRERPSDPTAAAIPDEGPWEEPARQRPGQLADPHPGLLGAVAAGRDPALVRHRGVGDGGTDAAGAAP